MLSGYNSGSLAYQVDDKLIGDSIVLMTAYVLPWQEIHDRLAVINGLKDIVRVQIFIDTGVICR